MFLKEIEQSVCSFKKIHLIMEIDDFEKRKSPKFFMVNNA